MKIELNPVDIEIISTVAPIRVDSEELRAILRGLKTYQPGNILVERAVAAIKALLGGVRPKNCPFCYGKPCRKRAIRNGYENRRDDPEAYAYFIRCISCAATGGWAKNQAGAIRCWNMRTGASS